MACIHQRFAEIFDVHTLPTAIGLAAITQQANSKAATLGVIAEVITGVAMNIADVRTPPLHQCGEANRCVVRYSYI